jgi:hypothetical protein
MAKAREFQTGVTHTSLQKTFYKNKPQICICRFADTFIETKFTDLENQLIAKAPS